MKVIVYSTPTCPYCLQLKEWLTKHNVEFQDIDVSADRAKAEEMIKKSGQMGVPVTEVGEQIVIGFDRDQLGPLLGIKV